MDKAIIGYCRIGYFRIGVRTDYWEQFKTDIENLGTPKKIIVDGSTVKVDEATWRVDIFIDQFETFKRSLENV